MAHVHHSTPTAGLEAILDVMPFDLFTQHAAVDLFYDRWKMRWTRLLTCCQTKFWWEDPRSLGDALACLDCLTLGQALQAITGH